MLTKTCTLTLPGGRHLRATVVATSPERDAAVNYTSSPDVDVPAVLADYLFDSATPAFLEVCFKNVAEEHGFELSVEQTGEYDNWAE